jgi:hypothetical protein
MREKYNFTIKNKHWKMVLVNDDAEELERDDDEMSVCGITHFAKATIYINMDINTDVLADTITHELTHAYMFVYGFGQVENFTEEMVCDFMGAYAKEIVIESNKMYLWALANIH